MTARLKSIAFRFWFAFVLLGLAPFPLGQIPFTDKASELWLGALQRLVPWVGAHVLRMAKPIEFAVNGSGDRTWNYVQWFCFSLIALIALVIWSALDRRTAHPRLSQALRIYVRFALASHVLVYGLGKLVPMQFPHLTRSWLTPTFGDISPMRLLWTFMGFSPAYAAFAGAAETLGSALLFFRRTTALGALILVGVLGNVAIMNFCYDVPVKLFSSFLLLLAVWLASADARRLVHFFLLNRPAEPAPLDGPFLPPRLRFARQVAKLALIAALVGPTIRYMSRIDERPEEIAELYRTEGPAGPWASAELTGWLLNFKKVDGSSARLIAIWDRKGEKLTLKRPGSETAWVLKSKIAADRSLELEGNLMDDAIQVRLRRFEQPPIPLLSRGFHWVNEYPYNR
jgi:hypothetical protein